MTSLLRNKQLILKIFFLFMALNLSAQIKNDPAQVLPEEINGWKIEQVDRLFDNETLYDYIDGSAEMFLSFGYSKVFNRIYSRSNQPDIIVDIFYMNSSYDAFGVFTHSVGRIEKEFGQQSQQIEGAIIFWKNNYYVSILCHPETVESKQTIYELAKIIDKSLTETEEFPPVLKYLPQKNLLSESIRYFRHYNWINSHTFISNDNILNINQNTHGILARYNNEINTAIFLLIMYPDELSAGSALSKFVNSYHEKVIPDQFQQFQNNLWFSIKRVKNFIIGIFDSTSKEFAGSVLDGAESIINK